MHPFAAVVEAAIHSGALVPEGAGCVVAVSGGCDSMVLMRVLAELVPRHDWRLVIAHFHHQLRGPEADADERLVASEATRLGLPFVSGTADVRGARRSGESLEAVARNLRHAFLARVALEEGCERIATGHHADDGTELFLLRLLRGAGSLGLGGMEASAPSPAEPGLRLVRPLLRLTRSQIAEAARDMGVPFHEDASNGNPAHRRNRVRLELIPLLRARYQPALDRVLERERTLLRDQAKLVEGLATRWIQGGDTTPFETLPVALQRDVLRLQLESHRIAPSFDLIETLRQGSDTWVQVDAGRRLARSGHGRLRVSVPTPPPPPYRSDSLRVALVGSSGEIAFGGLAIRWTLKESLDRPAPRPWTARPSEGGLERFDADILGPVIGLRHWQPGDRFRPLGLPAAAKLQDLFTQARTPVAERRSRVLAELAGGELFWVQGLRIGEAAKVTPRTRRQVVWTWAST